MTVVAGDKTVRVNATDATSGVARVELWVDGVQVGASTEAPYDNLWAAGAAPYDEHVLEVRAYDMAGNMASAARTVVSVPTTPEGIGQSVPELG